VSERGLGRPLGEEPGSREALCPIGATVQGEQQDAAKRRSSTYARPGVDSRGKREIRRGFRSRHGGPENRGLPKGRWGERQIGR